LYFLPPLGVITCGIFIIIYREGGKAFYKVFNLQLNCIFCRRLVLSPAAFLLLFAGKAERRFIKYLIYS